MNLKQIAITGPESTGKSWLAERLARYYHTIWVPEVARDYLLHLGRAYVFKDIVKIARAQLEMENNLADKAGELLFCDTDLVVTKIWSLFNYGKCDPWIVEKVRDHRYDLYLLCDIDLPWEDDPLREHPDRRKELFDFYLRELKDLHTPYRIISGTGEERLRQAISAVDGALGIGRRAESKKHETINNKQ